MRGKIIKGIAGFYYVHDGISKVYECKAKGVFRSRKIKPLVGDDVEFTVLDEKEQTGNLTDILERKNELIRPAVANIDQAMIVFAVTDPEPNLNLLDRFLVTMEMQGVPAVICFNKMDLGTGERERELRQIYEAAGYSVYFTSANDKESVDMVRELLKGKTTALAGPSGVGKSSLTNQIQPEAAHGDRGHQRKDPPGPSYHQAFRAVFCGAGNLRHGYSRFQLHLCGVPEARGAFGIFS